MALVREKTGDGGNTKKALRGRPLVDLWRPRNTMQGWERRRGKEVRRGGAGGVKRKGRDEEEGKEVSRGGAGGRGETRRRRRNTWRSDGEENVKWRGNVWNRAKKEC